MMWNILDPECSHILWVALLSGECMMAEQELRNREQLTLMLPDRVLRDGDGDDLRVHLGGLRGRRIFPTLIAPTLKHLC